MASAASDAEHHPPKLTRFFLTISIFIIGISVLAAYATIMAAEHSIKKDDIQIESLSHLVKSQDWENDYQAHKLREKIYQTEVDNLNNTLHQQPPVQQSSSTSHQQQQNIYVQTLSKYQSYLSKLHADKSVSDSIANLADKVRIEQKLYEQSLLDSSQNSKFVEAYDFATILLIIGAGLGGISEIAKNKMIGYPSLVVGGLGIIVLLLTTLMPSLL
jgi:hypothetical protein